MMAAPWLQPVAGNGDSTLIAVLMAEFSDLGQALGGLPYQRLSIAVLHTQMCTIEMNTHLVCPMYA
jgi:hypothetical protein